MTYVDSLKITIQKCPLDCAFNGVLLDAENIPNNSKVFWCQNGHVVVFDKDAWKEVWDFTKPEWLR